MHIYYENYGNETTKITFTDSEEKDVLLIDFNFYADFPLNKYPKFIIKKQTLLCL